jgi:hypothetical protein
VFCQWQRKKNPSMTGAGGESTEMALMTQALVAWSKA